jgi:hypothetical protein
VRSALLGALLVLTGAAAAQASFPYPSKLVPGQAPSEFSESGDWKFAATPDPTATSGAAVAVANQPDELCGIRGMSLVDRQSTQPAGSCAHGTIHTAWEVSTGRPDVTIAVLDSGIEWNDASAMSDLRAKVRLNQGELPAPHHDLRSALVTGVSCGAYKTATGGDHNPRGNYDVNHDGVFNVLDYACDARVGRIVDGGAPRHALRHGPPGMLTPEDLILAFSDGRDHDHNGFANDIAGWNFVDDNNDPYDDVHYGHGTGEALDSTAEAGNGGDLGSCPNCMVLPLRVGESFVTDANRFAQAALYATDRGANVIQEALGTINAPQFAQQAIEYAYNHGVPVVASAADEAAEHHNEPGALADAIVVNSVTKYSSLTSSPPSYLQLNGCTNFGTRIVLAVPSSSCSSEATGKSAGVAGLIVSAAENAVAGHRLKPSTDCHRIDGSRCVITANEVRQLMASGDIGSLAAADSGRGQADDVNFAAQPESSCAARASTCTDPNRQITFAPDQHGGAVGPLPHSQRYPARKGFDEFYGYGRLNAEKAVSAAANGTVPPEAEILGPAWFTQVDPGVATFALRGAVAARTKYRCEVDVAPGGQPNNAVDFHRVPSAWCNGTTVHRSAFRGIMALVSTARIKALMPPRDFTGNAGAQDASGRPNTLPYAFTVRILVRTAAGRAMSGEDRRQLFLHRDHDMLSGFPLELNSDGASSPLLIDLDGDNRNELIVATSDGLVHALRPNGAELPGWPVRTARLPLHLDERAYHAIDGVGADHGAAVIGALAAGDLFGDGRLEVVADDNQGNVYAWDQAGHVVFHRHSDPRFSGAPLSAFHTVRQGVRDRTEHGFAGAPVLASLDGHGLDVIAAGEDRHVYAWHANGRPVAGFPVLVADRDKVAAVDPQTHHLTFHNVDPSPGLAEDQGKIIDTPAVARLPGSAHPVIIVGTNEEYGAGTGDEGAVNISPSSSLLTSPLAQAGALSFANGRVYAIRSDGALHGQSPFLPGWPVKIGIIDAGLLPDVGEGINGSPVVAPVRCPSGGFGMKIGVTPDAGPAYILNANGTSCYGTTAGRDNTLGTDFTTDARRSDTPTYAAVGYPAFGTLDGHTISLFAPATGLIRALDVAANEYQGGQDFLGAWDPTGEAFRPGFPAPVNDLQFLTGPAIGRITARGGQSVIEGTSSQDLEAFRAGGGSASGSWPKLTGDWIAATPTLGSFGTLDTVRGARKDVVSITRSGTLSVYRTPAPACSPSSSPRFHHDIANSGDYTRDAVPPGAPLRVSLHGRRLSFRAPGGDEMCGTAARYQLVTSSRPLNAATFARGRRLAVSLTPARAGVLQRLAVPRRALKFLALRAVDSAGNVGRPIVLRIG